MPEWRIQRVRDDDTPVLEEVRELFTEYHQWLGDVVCSVRLAEEIADLPGPYAEPTGRLFIARDSAGTPIGCIGVRPHSAERCEVKRLYVREAGRGSGLGRALIETALETARELGYAEALVTTLPASMPVAAAMYERMGFVRVDPFTDHSHVSEDVEMAYLALPLR